jgi:3-deoxy-D-manno-octulosonic-acid transferase
MPRDAADGARLLLVFVDLSRHSMLNYLIFAFAAVMALSQFDVVTAATNERTLRYHEQNHRGQAIPDYVQDITRR